VACAATFRTSAVTSQPAAQHIQARALLAPASAPERHAKASNTAERQLPTKWAPAARSDYQRAARPAHSIRAVVIHVAEAPSALSVIHQFQHGGVGASAHYVVSQTGQVTQMVPDRSTAWHAGNRHYNSISIGIEHAGYTNARGSVTESEYRASARLLAHLAQTYEIPLDRQHVIGHNEVPDPTNPRLHGGYDHHTDPGRYWNWSEYMRYAHLFAANGPDALPIVPGSVPVAPPAPTPPATSTPSPPAVNAPTPPDVTPPRPPVNQ
jgi:N-acetyl-anhydromuramyl-L-alanine amidase AmpD